MRALAGSTQTAGVLAQSVEHRTFNPQVVGSIPTHPTIPPGFVLTTSVTVYSGPLLTDSDGVTLTRQLKSLPQFAHIPIILMTGDSRRQTLFSSMQAGAVDFVARSFTRDVVRARLEKVLRLGTVPDPA